MEETSQNNAYLIKNALKFSLKSLSIKFTKLAKYIDMNRFHNMINLLSALSLVVLTGVPLLDFCSSFGVGFAVEYHPSRKHLRAKVTPSLHLTCSKNGGGLG